MLATNIKKNVFVAISAVCLFATVVPAVMIPGGLLFTLTELWLFSKVMYLESIAKEDVAFFKSQGLDERHVAQFQSMYPIK